MKIEFYTSLPDKLLCERDKGAEVLRVNLMEFSRLTLAQQHGLLAHEEEHLKIELKVLMERAKAEVQDKVRELTSQYKPTDQWLTQDSARMSVPEECPMCGNAETCSMCEVAKTPVVDLPVRECDPADLQGLPEVKDHVIRAYDTDRQCVVYWQKSFGWAKARFNAQRYTRLTALELANTTNAMDGNDNIINVCAIQEID